MAGNAIDYNPLPPWGGRAEVLKDHHYDPWNWHEYLSDEPEASRLGDGRI